MEQTESIPCPIVVCDAGPLIHLIGILVRAIRRHQRTKEQILAILLRMPANSSLHIKRSLLEAVILEVEQSQ
jgi:hypothetical protein